MPLGPPLELGANPISTVVMLALLSMLPFLLMMTTSFLKFSVVLSILRNALGTQQIPPNPVLLGLALILSVYVMSPVAAEVYDGLRGPLAQDSEAQTLSGRGAESILDAVERAMPPLKRFMTRHAHQDEVDFFVHWARRMGPQAWKEGPEQVQAGHFIVLLPACTCRSEEHTSELQSPCNLVCRLLLEKKKIFDYTSAPIYDACTDRH